MSEQTLAHAELMDATYRYQRFIYDATRRYFLLGRDHLISNLQPPKGGRVLEVACGTGRNLALLARRHPDCRLYGLDISEAMLRTARVKLSAGAVLARADACGFEAGEIFGVAEFDRIILSYSLSMIPDWKAALETSVRHLAPGGELHVVDFGDQAELPRQFRSGLRAWLAKFHVEPRAGLAGALAEIAARSGCTVTSQRRFRDYAQYSVLTRG
ncbi:MAG TPA: methyltransferase domain-containing protein [Paracoccaceae bacterium]